MIPWPVAAWVGRRLARGLLVVLLWTILATIVYAVIEGWSWLDSLYMTVITIFTIGYEEVHPLSEAGRIWTLIVIGVGFVLVAVGASYIAADAASGELVRLWREGKLSQDLSRLRDHYIICGLGRVGWQIVLRLREENAPFCAVDLTDKHSEELIAWDVPHLVADATDDTVLRRVGVERARGLVAAADTDAVNLLVVVSARSLAPDLYIIARANDPANEEKLLRVGANRVLSPAAQAGRRIASMLRRPLVVEYVDLLLQGESQELPYIVEQIEIGAGADLCSLSLAEARARFPRGQGPTILAIKPQDRDVILHPGGATTLSAGDLLIAAGTHADLAQLEHLCHAEASESTV